MVESGYINVSVWSIKLWLDQDIYIYVSVWSIKLWLVGSKYISKVGVLNCGIIMMVAAEEPKCFYIDI